MVDLRIVERVACLAVAIVAVGCRPASPQAVESPTLAAPVEIADAAPTPTMSPEVLQSASECHGWRIGRAVQPSRLISATYAAGHWSVALEGLWEFAMLPQSTAPAPPGAPTSTPMWEGEYFVTRCRMTLNVAGNVGELSAGGLVTATPPHP